MRKRKTLRSSENVSNIFRYVKNSECLDGIEDYLSDASVMRRESNQPILFLYGNDKKTNNGIIEIENNDFYAHGDEQDDEDEDEDEFTRNLIWKTDSSQQVKAIVFDESSKQVFVAIENEQLSFVYRLGVRILFEFSTFSTKKTIAT